MIDLKVDKTSFLKNDKVKNAIAGTIAGAVNGIFGGGGGIVLLPLLKYFLKTDVKSAHATSIMVMLPISFISAIVYLAKDISILKDGAIYGICGVFGALLSAKYFKKASKTIPTLAFSVTAVIMAAMILFE